MTTLDDHTARRIAVSEFARPVLLEAGAGTGKTRTLVARIGTWLLDPGWTLAQSELTAEREARGGVPPEPDEIAARVVDGVAAITFTEAAAAEMTGRADRLLGEAAAGGPIADLDPPPAGVATPELRRRAVMLLAVSGRLRISTIHGFCHRLLAEHPLEAGLHPSFRVDPENELLQEIATSVVRERLRDGDARLVELLADGVDPPQLLAALVELAKTGVRPEELAREPFDEAALGALWSALCDTLEAVVAGAAPLGTGRRVDSIADGLAALASLRAELAAAAPSPNGLRSLGPALETSATAAKKILDGWAKGKFGKTEQKALGAGLAELERAAADCSTVHAALRELDPPRLARARAALAPLLTELRGRSRAHGLLSFHDLLEKAAGLLAERDGVLARVRRGLRQLLVDEFQDTDRLQCALLHRLVLAESAAPPPCLFLVGDPQQSIYGWRSADLASYFDFRQQMTDTGAVRGALEVNFRSAPPILDEVERALAPVLREEAGLQAGFAPLRACARRAADAGFVACGRAPIEYWSSRDPDRVALGRDTPVGRAAEIEAAAIAGEISELVGARAARWGDFALLLRTRSDLDVYLAALRHAGVPYEVQKDRSYYRRREVVDAAAAVRAILDPADLLALVAFLRSPFVGVPDAAWLPLWRSGFPAAMLALADSGDTARVHAAIGDAVEEVGEPGALLSIAGWHRSLAEAVDAIADLRGSYYRLPLSSWIERLRSSLVLEPIAAARFLGRFGLANLERFFSALETRLADEPDPGRALDALRRAVAEETAAEEARPPDAEEDAVAVMTVHTAKGLQFGHVYVVQAQKRPQRRAADAAPGAEIGPAGAVREYVLFGSPTPGWRRVTRERARVAAAESARLLYVATTRAMDRLVICGSWGDAARGGSATAPSFADLLAARVAGAPTPDAGRPVVADPSGALWRLAAAGPTGSAGVGASTRAAAGGEQLDAGALAGERSAARARSARRRIGTASALVDHSADPHQESPDPQARQSQRLAQRLALARGVALHRALELVELAVTDRDAWRSAIEQAWRRAGGEELGAGPATALDEELSRLPATALWRRLAELAPRTLARELPLLVVSSMDDPDRPLDGTSGTLDLLYRDPETGEHVVADFKSDEVAGQTAIGALIELYRPQLGLYGRAVHLALGLDAPPRLELWLLAADRVVVVGSPLARADSG